MERLDEYKPLPQGDYHDSEGSQAKDPLLPESYSPALRASSLRANFVPLACALALLLANVLLLAYATTTFRSIFHQLEELLDVVDTWALPRPDPLYKLGKQ